MQHAAVVGVVDGVADVHEPAEELAKLERLPARVAFQSRVGVEPSIASLSESPRMNRMA